MEEKYAFVEAHFLQGFLDNLLEIKTFATLEEAQLFLEQNKEIYQASGHVWNGATSYGIMQIIDNKYADIEGVKIIDYGCFGPPSENVYIRKKK